MVDSVTSLYRAEYRDYSMLSRRQHQLLKIMHTLRNIAQAYNTVIVVTNQIQTTPEERGYNSDKPVGGNVMAHTSAFQISLRQIELGYNNYTTR